MRQGRALRVNGSRPRVVSPTDLPLHPPLRRRRPTRSTGASTFWRAVFLWAVAVVGVGIGLLAVAAVGWP